MTLRAGLLALALASTMLAACGGPSPAPPSSASLTRVSTITADTNPRGPKAGDEKAPTTTDTEAITGLVGFTSPTGNVGCYIDSTGLRCDIAERTWTPPPRPADCEFDYGQGITMPIGEMPAFVCAGDTALSEDKPLEYGKSVSVGPLTCDSTEAGITCRDATTSHGFTIARDGYRLF